MVPLMISNMAAEIFRSGLDFGEKCRNVATACASGSHCIGDAFGQFSMVMQISWLQEERESATLSDRSGRIHGAYGAFYIRRSDLCIKTV